MKTESRDDDYFECDYDRDVTPLYQAIEEKAWYAVDKYLWSGYWPNSLLYDPVGPREQSYTWVTRFETQSNGDKKIRWSHLPIHAAIIFGAPLKVVQKLIELFPMGLRCTDDNKMLPLHLAFLHGASDSVIALLIEEFPGASHCKGQDDKVPHEFAKLSPKPQRAFILQTIIDSQKSSWEKKEKKRDKQMLKEVRCVKKALKDKNEEVDSLERTLSEIRGRERVIEKELIKTKGALDSLKKKRKHLLSKSKGENEEEREAAEKLIKKLSDLEKTTKDLLQKETETENELRNAIGDLENLNKMKFQAAPMIGASA